MGDDRFIKSAKKYCSDNHLRLTPPRQYILEILAKSNVPLGAYDILKKLGHYIDNPKPPTAYRAIDFWREHGFVHKIESLNAFITCCEGHTHHHDTHFLVCDDCHAVEELHVHNQTHNLPKGFVAKKTFTETHGRCRECAE